MLGQAALKLLEEMRDQTVKAGITEAQIQQVSDFVTTANGPDVRDVLIKLQEIRGEAYQLLLNQWNYYTPERWENIRMLEDLEGHKLNETIVLEKKRTELRRAWRQLLHATKTTKQNVPGSSGESVRV